MLHYQGTYLGKNAGVFGKAAFNEFGGCFAKTMRVNAKFAIKLPDNLPAELVI